MGSFDLLGNLFASGSKTKVCKRACFEWYSSSLQRCSSRQGHSHTLRAQAPLPLGGRTEVINSSVPSRLFGCLLVTAHQWDPSRCRPAPWSDRRSSYGNGSALWCMGRSLIQANPGRAVPTTAVVLSDLQPVGIVLGKACPGASAPLDRTFLVVTSVGSRHPAPSPRHSGQAQGLLKERAWGDLPKPSTSGRAVLAENSHLPPGGGSFFPDQAVSQGIGRDSDQGAPRRSQPAQYRVLFCPGNLFVKPQISPIDLHSTNHSSKLCESLLPIPTRAGLKFSPFRPGRIWSCGQKPSAAAGRPPKVRHHVTKTSAK